MDPSIGSTVFNERDGSVHVHLRARVGDLGSRGHLGCHHGNLTVEGHTRERGGERERGGRQQTAALWKALEQ